jgi:hypothetical protein
VLIKRCEPAIYEPCFVTTPLRAGNLLLELLRKPIVVGIQGSDIFPMSLPYPSIPGSAYSSIALPDEMKSGIISHEFLDYGTSGVR